MEVFAGGAWRTISRAEAYVNGAWRRLRYAEGYIDGEWRQIASFIETLALSLNAYSMSRNMNSATVTTNNCIATPSGGLGPFTYAWTKISGDDIIILSPSVAVTKFEADGLALGETRVAGFRCTVTDSMGSTATADVVVTLTHSNIVLDS